MDAPDHMPRRKAVGPALTQGNVVQGMAPLVRERAGQILDNLPIGKEFDWVDLVSKELTAMTLATLFDFPFEQRRNSPIGPTCSPICPATDRVTSWQQKGEAIFECFGAFHELWNQRVNAAPPATISFRCSRTIPRRETCRWRNYQGTVVLLIIGGETTRHETRYRAAFTH